MNNQPSIKLYHGTDADFSEFILPTECTNHEYFGEAVYFSDNPDVARYSVHA